MSKLVLLSIQDHVATITLNRPERLNALTHDLMTTLRACLESVASDTNIRAVCLTGAGRGFCAGQDLSERDPRHYAFPLDLEAFQKELFHPVVRLISQMPKPVVARVGGVAAGAGSSLALMCDIVVAGQSARFVQSFSKVGLSVDAGGGWQLTHALGPVKAKALLMLGDTLSAEEAAEAGLIYKAVPDEALNTMTDDLLQRLVQTPGSALLAIKSAVSSALNAPNFEEYLLQEAALQGTAGKDPNYAEGVLAFLEKRSPNFR